MQNIFNVKNIGSQILCPGNKCLQIQTLTNTSKIHLSLCLFYPHRWESQVSNYYTRVFRETYESPAETEKYNK